LKSTPNQPDPLVFSICCQKWEMIFTLFHKSLQNLILYSWTYKSIEIDHSQDHALVRQGKKDRGHLPMIMIKRNNSKPIRKCWGRCWELSRIENSLLTNLSKCFGSIRESWNMTPTHLSWWLILS